MTAMKPTMLPKSFKLPTNDIIPSIGFGLYKIDRSRVRWFFILFVVN